MIHESLHRYYDFYVLIIAMQREGSDKLVYCSPDKCIFSVSQLLQGQRKYLLIDQYIVMKRFMALIENRIILK